MYNSSKLPYHVNIKAKRAISQSRGEEKTPGKYNINLIPKKHQNPTPFTYKNDFLPFDMQIRAKKLFTREQKDEFFSLDYVKLNKMAGCFGEKSSKLDFSKYKKPIFGDRNDSMDCIDLASFVNGVTPVMKDYSGGGGGDAADVDDDAGNREKIPEKKRPVSSNNHQHDRYWKGIAGLNHKSHIQYYLESDEEETMIDNEFDKWDLNHSVMDNIADIAKPMKNSSEVEPKKHESMAMVVVLSSANKKEKRKEKGMEKGKEKKKKKNWRP